jgi:hypothetical protein
MGEGEPIGRFREQASTKKRQSFPKVLLYLILVPALFLSLRWTMLISVLLACMYLLSLFCGAAASVLAPPHTIIYATAMAMKCGRHVWEV